jgi:mRNA interferase MazF
VPFPFDNLSSTKVRPAVCLTNPIGQYEHIILALITSKIPQTFLESDYVLDLNHSDFQASGLRKASTIKLDHLMTLRKSMIQRELGQLSSQTQTEIAQKLYQLFNN